MIDAVGRRCAILAGVLREARHVAMYWLVRVIATHALSLWPTPAGSQSAKLTRADERLLRATKILQLMSSPPDELNMSADGHKV